MNSAEQNIASLPPVTHGNRYQETAAAVVHEDLQLVGNNWGGLFELCRDGMPLCASSDCKHMLQASRESSDARAIPLWCRRNGHVDVSRSDAERCEHDAVSHFLLRLLCCGDAAGRSWCLSAEEDCGQHLTVL